TPAVSGRRTRSDAERRIAKVWEDLFHPQPVSLDDNFFLDLGGHSLLAARMVSELRRGEDPRLARISVIDVYQYPTIASLAAAFDVVPPGSSRPSSPARSPAVSAGPNGRGP